VAKVVVYMSEEEYAGLRREAFDLNTKMATLARERIFGNGKGAVGKPARGTIKTPDLNYEAEPTRVVVTSTAEELAAKLGLKTADQVESEPRSACVCRHIPAVQRMQRGSWHGEGCAWREA